MGMRSSPCTLHLPCTVGLGLGEGWGLGVPPSSSAIEDGPAIPWAITASTPCVPTPQAHCEHNDKYERIS